jgi:glycosyltransferase involved in cell wall biosynthesis
MKILFVTQYFYPESFRGNDIAFDLAKRGEDVTVITAIPNYPTGKFFDGYNLFKKRKEIINNVKVIRLPVIPRGKGSALSLLLNYGSFAIVASLFSIYLSIKVKFDLIFAQQLSPVSSVLPAIIVKKIQKIPLYLWVLDLWPESLISAGNVKNKYIISFFMQVVKSAYRNSDIILISSRGFVKSIEKKGNYTRKIIYFPNWAEDVFTNNSHFSIPELPSGFLVMFAGNIGESQDFENIMNAALLLKENKKIKFIFIGDGRKKDFALKFSKEHNLEQTVYFYGHHPIKLMPAFFRHAAIMLLPLKDELIFNLTVPAKLQAFMASAKPVIGMLNGEGAEIIKDAKCGLSVLSGDYKDLVKQIEILYSMSNDDLNILGENGRNYYECYFNKGKSLSYLYDLITSSINNNESRLIESK